MSEVRRICAHCGEAVPLEGRYCARCGYDFDTALPVQSGNLPMVLGKAALPMLVGAAGLMLRAGWKLAQSQWAKDTARNVLDMAFNRVQNQPPRDIHMRSAAPVHKPAQPPAPPTPAPRARRTIRIRSTWAVGDANGVWEQGASEQTIEIDD
jgi:hypothetical protein